MSKYKPHLTREQTNEKLIDIAHYIKSVLGDKYGVLLVIRDDEAFFAHEETQGCGEPCQHEIDAAITNRSEEGAEHLATCWLQQHGNRQTFFEKGN